MSKSAQDLDVNIVLSKYGFIGVASFEIIKFGIWKLDFSCVFACKKSATLQNTIFTKYTACQTQYFGEILHFQRQMFVKC